MRCVESVVGLPNGDIWVGSWYYEGLARFDGKKWTQYKIKTDVRGTYTPENWQAYLPQRR